MSNFPCLGGRDVIVIDSDDELHLDIVQKRQKLNQKTGSKASHNIVKSRQIRSTMLPASKPDIKQSISESCRDAIGSSPLECYSRPNSPSCLGKRVRDVQPARHGLHQSPQAQSVRNPRSHDEGYGSLESSDHSPESHQNDTEDAESFAMRWADLTRVEMGSSNALVSETHKRQRTTQLAALAKRDELTRLGVQKSQLLRAKAFANHHPETPQAKDRCNLPNVSDPAQVEHAEPNKPLELETVMSTCQNNDSTNPSDISEHIDHEMLLDQAQGWAQGQNQSPSTYDTVNEMNPFKPTSAINPQSRAAAELYRTQNRHMRDHDDQNQDQDHLRHNALELRQAEPRLLMLSRLHQSDNHGSTAPQQEKESVFSSPHRFHAASSSPTPPLRMPKFGPPLPACTSDYRPKKQRFLGSEADRMAGEFSRQGRFDTSTKNSADQSSYSILRSYDNVQIDDRDSKSVSDGFEIKAQGIDLTLPKTFDDLDEQTQLIVRKHETLKERERDLKAIKEASLAVAQLGAMIAFQDTHYDRIREIRHFIKIVLKDGLCSRAMRTRITNIRDSFRRRAGKYGTPSKEKIDIVLRDLLSHDEATILIKELSNLKQDIQHLGAQRLEGASGRSSTRPRIKKKKKVRFQSLPAEDENIDLVEHENPHLQSFSKAERSRQAYERSQDRKIAQLKAKRDQFDEFQPRHCPNITEESPTQYLVPIGDDSENDSEEVEGEQLYPGLCKGSLPTQNTEDESGYRSENDHQQMRTASQLSINEKTMVKSSQNPDISLIQQAESEAAERHHRLKIGIQRRNHDLIEHSKDKKRIPVVDERRTDCDEIDELSDYGELTGEELSCHFDDSDLDDYEEPRTLYRYKVLAVFRGLPGRTDGCVELIGRYMSSERAQRKAIQAMHNVQDRYRQMEPDYGNHHKINHTLQNELLELSYESILGRQVGCRIWMEQEIRNVGRELYEKAKHWCANIMDSIYAVEWKRTIVDYMSADETEDEGDENEIHTSDEQIVSIQAADGDANELSTNHVAVSEIESQEPHHESSTGTEDIETVTATEKDYVTNLDEPDTATAGRPATVDDDALTSNDNFIESEVPMPQDSEGNTHQIDTDDLFGDTASDIELQPPLTHSSSEETKPKASIFKEITTSALSNDSTKLFTSIAYANRHAKNVFFHWFVRDPALQGISNLAFVRAADEAFEAELERLEDLSTWQGSGEYEGSRTDETTGEDVKTTERFTVWVRKIHLRGPVNR